MIPAPNEYVHRIMGKTNGTSKDLQRANAILKRDVKKARKELKAKCRKAAAKKGGSVQLQRAMEKYPVGSRCYVKWGDDWQEATVLRIYAGQGRNKPAIIEHRFINSQEVREAEYKNFKAYEEMHG
ncbi:hypothetical protein DFP72DRAFT_856602 [Ephemerocybe angulata]|uniref:Uncharacterized protein n=1 Tax=Ephemerocybe angulata TaxID=980116 RepID=A0A8H6LWJ4_9AGAR|nr:hypothetical protein DFP72DRAFT_858698 [Tulosesus angulatus]KAF6745340.1 hypothetical protein DFP72DRAFT_856602 [Tulosesus angulatus]